MDVVVTDTRGEERLAWTEVVARWAGKADQPEGR